MIEDGLVVFCKVTVVDHTRRSGSVMLWCREVTMTDDRGRSGCVL